MGHLHSQSMDRLFQAVMQLDSLEECYRFFEDICTVKELRDLAQRLEVAVLLSQGINYQQISQQVGASTATISRVSRCLNYGTGGYRAAIEKLEEDAP